MLSRISKIIRDQKATSCSVVVAAAGSSVRMGEDKLTLELLGKPVLIRTLSVLDSCSFVNEIILVCREEALEKYAKMCADWEIKKVSKVIIGGATRTESVLAGLLHIDRNAKIVLVHDGARPLITPDLVYSVMHAAALYKFAVPAMKITDTVKEVEGQVAKRTLDRDKLITVQTPQGFVPDIIKAALTKAISENQTYTDDCAAVEAMGIPVHIVDGSPENIKITFPSDISVATGILERRDG